MDITKVNFEPIIEKAKQSEEGLSELLVTIQSYVIQKSRAILGSYEDAEDIYQIVSIRLYNNLNNINPKGFMSYLKTAVTNACNDELRKRHKLTEEGDEINTFSVDAFEDYEIPAEDNRIDLLDEYRNKVVFEVLDNLPLKQKEAIILRYVDNLKIKDIAAQLGVNENTVKTRLYSAYDNIKDEILRIQDRDDIKLYSYSPVLFFLLLLRRSVEYIGPVNNLLLEKTTDEISRSSSINQVDKIVENEATKNIVGKGIKNATSAVGKKAGLSAGVKAVIGIAVAAVIGTSGLFAYKAIEDNNLRKLYQEDEVKINLAIEGGDDLELGDVRKVSADYTSSNNLDYDIEITSSREKVAAIEDDTLKALRTGQATIFVNLKKDGEEIKKRGFNIVIEEQTANYNKEARLMKQERYRSKSIYNPAFSDELLMPYSQFDWSLMDRTFSDFLKSNKRFKDDLVYYSVYMDGGYASTDTPDEHGFFSDYGFFPYRGYSMYLELKDVNTKAIVLRGEYLNSKIDLIYEAQYDKYSYISPATGKKEWLDFTSVVFTPMATDGSVTFDVEYDENYNVIRMTGQEPWIGTVSYEFEYENGRIFRVHQNRYFNSIFDVFYHENGLLDCMIQYEAGGSQRVLSVHKYYYSKY